MINLDGPRVAPLSNGAAKQLVVLCHGYGSNGEDLISLVPYWQQALPEAAFAAPNAPEPVAMAPGGYQWFDLGDTNRTHLDVGVRTAAPILEAFLSAELTRTGVDARHLALVGFSQGTMMALHVGLRRSVAPAGILGYSGLLLAPGALPSELQARPPVMLIHGDQDPMIPVAALHESVRHLSAVDIDVQWHVSQGVGHAIAPDGMALGAQFLAVCFAK